MTPVEPRRERLRAVIPVRDLGETQDSLSVYFFTKTAGDRKHATLWIAKDSWGLHAPTDEAGWWWPEEDRPFEPKAMAEALRVFMEDEDRAYPWASAVAHGESGGELIVHLHKPGIRQASIGLMRERWWCAVPNGPHVEKLWQSDPRADTRAKPFAATDMCNALARHTRLVLPPGEALGGSR